MEKIKVRNCLVFLEVQVLLDTAGLHCSGTVDGMEREGRGHHYAGGGSALRLLQVTIGTIVHFSPLDGRQTAKNATQMLRVDGAR